jgi:hypothetical protein
VCWANQAGTIKYGWNPRRRQLKIRRHALTVPREQSTASSPSLAGFGEQFPAKSPSRAACPYPLHAPPSSSRFSELCTLKAVFRPFAFPSFLVKS